MASRAERLATLAGGGGLSAGVSVGREEREMRAVVISKFGGPEVLELRDVPKPHAGPGELLVKVVASGTNPVDAKLRANGAWAALRPPVILGADVSGVVEEVGAGVAAFKPGDAVYYTPEIVGNHAGSYAEYNVVRQEIVAPKPPSLTFIEAAAMPLAAGTAWEAVIRRLRLIPGETVLIHGGAGGVGSAAVQLAKAAGARVLASASSRNQALLEELGVDVPIDYGHQDVCDVTLRETEGRGADAVLDTVGGDTVMRSLGALRPFGRIATVLGPEGQLRLLYQRNLTLHGVFLTRERERLEQMTRLIEHGRLRPIIDCVLELEQVRQAHERLDSGHGHGKIVLRIAEG
jgi:NADPH:quinone reductase